MLKISSFLTGEDYSTLKNSSPLSRKKVHSLATVLLLPVLMWFATGYMLANTVLELPTSTSIIIAGFISFVIFLIERNIIMASGRGLIIMRIFIGFITALLGSIALDEVVFEHDISQQMVINKNELIKEKVSQIDSIYMNEISHQSLIVKEKHTNWQTSLTEARKEADGTGGSQSTGNGPITQMKLKIANQQKINYDQAESELASLQDKRDADKEHISKEIEESYASHALLLRIKALFDLIKADTYMRVIYILFTLFLFFIEFAVVLMKLGWKKTSYEILLATQETIKNGKYTKILENELKNYDPAVANPDYHKISKKLNKIISMNLL